MSGCSCHNTKEIKVAQTNKKFVTNLLIGAPNVGKSTFFNRITWQHSPVGNIDKVTVSSNLGSFKGDKNIKFLDLPGVYNLNPITKEEEIVIDNILNKSYDKIVNIISITSMRRDLLLTIELLESNRLSNLIVNMIDEWQNKNLNSFTLINKLGVPTSLISSTKNKNVKQAIAEILNFNKKKQFNLKYDEKIEKLISLIEEKINFESNISKRFLAIQSLNENWFVRKFLSEKDVHINFEEFLLENEITQDELNSSIRNTRIDFINQVCDKFLIIDENEVAKNNKKEFRDNKFDKLLLNKFFGIFMLIIVILAVYYITFGSYAGGWINEQWTGLLEKGQEAAFDAINSSGIANSFWVGKFVGDGLLGGIFTVIGFLPYIMIMYFLITILEHSGFLARMSVLLDKSLDKFGLSGRSIITLFTGVGCNIPAIMMARNSQSKKERVILILIGPLIACSARLVVYEWILQRMIGNNDFVWLMTLGLAILSGFVAVFVGYFFSNTLFRKQSNFFMTELPRWRAPHIIVILKGMGIEVWNFLKRVLTIIFVVNLVIFFLLYISPTNGLINSDDMIDSSLLKYISLPFQYLFYPIGLGEDWRLSVSLLAAAPAKELASSNLEILFPDVNGSNGFHEFLFNSGSIKAPVATSMSYLIFFSFYVPCIATIVVMKKEAGWKWTLIHLLTAFVLSYGLSLITYSFGGMIENLINNPNLLSKALPIIAITLNVINFGLIITIIVNQLIFNYKLRVSERFVKYKSIFWKFAIVFIFVVNFWVIWIV